MTETRDLDPIDLRRACMEGEGRVIVVTDEGIVASGTAGLFHEVVGLDYTPLVVPAGEPTCDSVDEVAQRLTRSPAEVVVAVGGGSVMDTAKLATSLAAEGIAASDALEGRSVPVRQSRLVAVPTTAGSGAEVTRTAVLSHGGRKTWAWGDPLRPDDACLVADLTLACPPGLSLASGLDAIVHAIEAGTSCRVDFTDERASHALRLALPALRGVSESPDDLDSRRSMQRAATLAGRAIDAHGTGGAHAIGHALSTVHGIPHGFAVGLALAATLDWSISEAPQRYEALCAAAGLDVARLPGVIGGLLDELGFVALASPTMPVELDVTALAEVIGAQENAPMRANNSRPIEPQDHAVLAELTATAWDHLRAAS